MFEVEICMAVPEDAAEFLAYTKRVGGQSDNLTFGAEGLPISEEQARAFLRAMNQERSSALFCARVDGVLVGTANISGLPRRMRHRAELAISVDRSYWSCGIGTRLMEAVIHYARENGVELLNLEVRKDNAPAIHLYQKFGFQTIGSFPAFFKIGNEYIDFLLMVLDLREQDVPLLFPGRTTT